MSNHFLYQDIGKGLEVADEANVIGRGARLLLDQQPEKSLIFAT